MAEESVHEKTDRKINTETKEIGHFNVFQDSKQLANQAIYSELLVEEQSCVNEYAEITQGCVGLQKVASVGDDNVYEMPLGKCNTDDCYIDVSTVPPKVNREQTITIHQPSCMGLASSQTTQTKTNPIPPVPLRKNSLREQLKSSFADVFDAREENRRKDKKSKWITTKRVVIFIAVMFILLTIFVGISFLLLRAEIVKLQADVHVLKLKSMDGNITNMLENGIKLDEKFEQLEYKSYINKEQLSNLTEMLYIYQDEFKYIKKVMAIGRFFFEPTTLHKNIYMSNDNRTISTYSISGGRRGSGNGYQNYKGVRGTVYFTNFDIVYFEVSVNYYIINPLNFSLLFEIGFSTAHTIDGSYFVGGQNESYSFACSSNINGSSIILFYTQNLAKYTFLKTLTVNSPNIAYRGLYGFYVHGPKGEIIAIDKITNVLLHRFDNVDFGNNLYPVFAVYGSSHWSTATLTLKSEH